MDRVFLALGAVNAFVGVALGAFGAHALRRRLSADMLAVFEIGVRYQMYHALALLALGATFPRLAGGTANAAGWLFLVGTIIFSGSLYALSLSGRRRLGAITPLGGLAFLVGWLCFAVSAWG